MNFEDIKVLGIVGGLAVSSIALFLNFYSTIRNIRSQKISNYQELIKSHREIWKLTLDDSNVYDRLFDFKVDLSSNPVTYKEALFIRLLFLHMSVAYNFAKYNQMLQIEKLEMDFSEILLSPLPRYIWAENRGYYNKDFVQFLERAGVKRDVFFILEKLFHPKSPAYCRLWRVLVLSDYAEKIAHIVKALGDEVVSITDKDPEVTVNFIKNEAIDFIVCFGYGRILKRKIINHVPCINIHVGYLPYNRGPNPNLWAWLDGTPKGVTIHYMDKNIDTGDIIAQKKIDDFNDATIQSSYDKHIETGISLFKEQWPEIRAGKNIRKKQYGDFTIHTLKDQECLENLLENGLNLPIEEFCSKAHEIINSQSIKNQELKYTPEPCACSRRKRPRG